MSNDKGGIGFNIEDFLKKEESSYFKFAAYNIAKRHNLFNNNNKCTTHKYYKI